MGKHDQLQDFQRYDFSQSEGFQTYLKSVEVLSNDPAALQRLKARWYKKNIDVNFDLAWLADLTPQSGTTSSTQGTSTSRATGFTSGATPRPNSTQPQPAPQPTRPASTGGAALPQRAQLFLVAYHASLVMLSLVHLVPVVPQYSYTAYRTFFQLVIVGEGYKLVQQHGLPRGLWPFNWPTLQAYISVVLPTNSLYFMLLGLSFANHRPQSLLTVPIVIRAVYGLIDYLATHAAQHPLWQRFGARAHAFLQSKKRESQLMSAYAEIAVGVMLVAGLLGRNRNIMLTFLFWNLLKMRYHVGEDAANHRLVWYAINTRTQGIRAQFPILERVIRPVSTWFLSVR